MMIVSITNAKGGTGKTTSSVYLATVAKKNLPDETVSIVDLDPQRSVSDWASMAEENGYDLPFVITDDLQSAIKDSDIVFIDCPPAFTSDVSHAIDISDLVVIPCECEPLSYRRAVKMLRTCDGNGVILLTKCRTRTAYFRQTRSAFADESVFDTVITDRMEYVKSFGTIPKNLSEYAAVWLEIRKAIS